jgi:hypothetical protein
MAEENMGPTMNNYLIGKITRLRKPASAGRIWKARCNNVIFEWLARFHMKRESILISRSSRKGSASNLPLLTLAILEPSSSSSRNTSLRRLVRICGWRTCFHLGESWREVVQSELQFNGHRRRVEESSQKRLRSEVVIHVHLSFANFELCYRSNTDKKN